MLKDWPDFFEKNQRKARESKGVLGKLYRELCNEPAYKSYMHNQFTYQVLMRWTLDEKILNKASSKDLLISYLEPVYTKIVQPMERQIRSLMFLFRQHTEAALFASDLKFHISSATTEDIHTSLKFAKADALSGAKPDEALSILNMKLTAMQKTFKGKLRTLIDSLQTEPMDLNIETNVCVALYLASYFHIKNPSCRAFAESCGDNAKLLAFMKAWQAD